MGLQPGRWHEFSRKSIDQVPPYPPGLDQPGVYFFRAKGRSQVYIGKSDGPMRERLRKHLRCIEVVQELTGIPASWELRFITSRVPQTVEYVALRGYADKVNRLETGNEACREVDKRAGIRPAGYKGT
jgi:hypothetical protein